MANKNNILGVTKFELGAPGDGIMGTSLTNYPDVEVGSINIEGSSANDETIATETSDAYITVNSGSTPASITARLYGVTPAEMVLLAGGTVNATSGLWEAPASAPSIFLSLKITGKEINGSKGIIQMPYAKTNARLQGTITKNGLPAVDITFTANTPVTALGVEGSPFSYGFETE